MLTRTFIIAITIITVWWPLRSLGLGLGDASVVSTLSSPLQVSIPLRGMQGANLDPERFSIDIEDPSRPYMQYRLQRIDEDTATIILYTRQMITEPLIHFRLKVKWDKVTVARSYDVFIDPPSYQFSPPEETVASSAGNVTTVEASNPDTGTVPEPIAFNPPLTVAETESGAIANLGRSEDPASQVDAETLKQRSEYGPTIDGNSIWRVARAVSTDNSELTIYQWMYGIWKANPLAFTGSNMHRLNMEKVLSIPLEREIAENSHSESWRAYSSQMAMLQSASSEVSPVDSSVNTVVAESTPGDTQVSVAVAGAEPAIGVAESVDVKAWWQPRNLGLGDASAVSTLSSPLRVSIPLRGLQGVSLDPEKFSIDIENPSRPNMQYQLERIDGDTATIVLYTRQMITEPLVHFRLKVKWDKITVARSYDVFIDPPSYQFNPPEETVASSTGDVTTVETSDTGTIPEPITVSPPVTAAKIESGAIANLDRSEDPASQVDTETLKQRSEYGPTIDGNSIWRVARAVSTDNSELTIYQWMYGIWKANPHAFTGSNMHRLNMEKVLSIPLEWEIAEHSYSESWHAYNSQMAMLQTATETSEVTQDIVQSTDTLVEATPETTGEVNPVDNSDNIVVDESTPGDTQASEVFADAEPALDVVESGDVDASDEISTIDVEDTQSPIVSDSLSYGEAEVSENTDVILDDLLADADADTQDDTTTVQSLPSAEVPLASSADEITPPASALESRMEYVAQLPIIGSDEPLAFIGRALQRADELISNNQSWAAIAIGGLVTLMLLMLIQQFRSRRRSAAIAAHRPRFRPLGVDDTLKDSKSADSAVARNKLETEDKAETTGDVKHAKEQETKPAQVARFDLSSDEIMEEVNALLANDNTSEAVKLLESTAKLQPDQMSLVLHLLEIYHRLEDAEAFETLVQRFRPALEVMEIRKQADLQVMYSRLCPNSPPLIGPSGATDLGDDTGGDQLRELDEVTDEIDEAMNSLAVDQANDSTDINIEYISTQEVTAVNNGILMDPGPDATPEATGDAIDLDVTLQEVDVYLAYGLYDHAEELLHKVKAAYPGHTDLMARLLDSYYATKNVADFEAEAMILKSTGDAADPYWEKVTIMGYELAPHNEMFAEGKNKNLGALELETAKPDLPDFNLAVIDESDHDLDKPEVDLEDDTVDLDLELVTTAEVRPEGDTIDLNLDLEAAEVSPVNETIDFDLDLDLDLNAAKVEPEDDRIDLDETGHVEAEEEIAPTEEFSDNLAYDDDDDDDDDDVIAQHDDDDEESMVMSISPDLEDAESDQAGKRILYFPDNSNDSVNFEQFDEFASEARMTLQAIRDQLQHLTERQYRQERKTNELHKSIAELSDDTPLLTRSKKKKLKKPVQK